MAKRKKQSTMGLVLALIVAAAAWYIKNKDGTDVVNQSEPQRGQSVAGERVAGAASEGEKSGGKTFTDSGLPEELGKMLSRVNLKKGEFDFLPGCSLIDHRHNDGDSFHVRHGGKQTEFRLYFVDTAESGFHKCNGKRLREQGAYFGGLNMQQTTAVGQMAKSFVKDLLKKQRFTVVTKWEDVYTPERKYCYVVVKWNGRDVYLHELLMAKGLVRLKTRGASMPEGKSYHTQKKKLKQMEAVVKRLKAGAWGM